MCHQPSPVPFALPPTPCLSFRGRICNLISQEGHPALAQLPFPASGDSSEVYCSCEVWVKGSQVPTHGGPPTLSTVMERAGPPAFPEACLC